MHSISWGLVSVQLCRNVCTIWSIYNVVAVKIAFWIVLHSVSLRNWRKTKRKSKEHDFRWGEKSKRLINMLLTVWHLKENALKKNQWNEFQQQTLVFSPWIKIKTHSNSVRKRRKRRREKYIDFFPLLCIWRTNLWSGNHVLPKSYIELYVLS